MFTDDGHQLLVLRNLILDQRFWIGTEWFGEIISSGRFWSCFWYSLLFSTLALSIQVPLGIAISVYIPRQRIWIGLALAVVALPLLVLWNMIPSLWLSLLNPDTGILGRIMATYGWSGDWKLSVVQIWLSSSHWTSLAVILCYSALTTIPAALPNC